MGTVQEKARDFELSAAEPWYPEVIDGGWLSMRMGNSLQMSLGDIRR